MRQPTSIVRPPHRHSTRVMVALTGLIAAVAVSVVHPSTTVSASVSPDDWLGIVNAYRIQSGLAPVTEEPSWSLGGQRHSCWMLLNGIAHDEAPGTPGYTPEGDAAGNNGNVAVSSGAAATARNHIDLWMTGPFHAIGLLRSSLTRTGFGMCANSANTATQWRSAATLDVLRGLNSTIRRTAPVVFPGNGATTSLTRFIAETPDPRAFCGWSGRTVGLPLIALMPSSFPGAVATLNGPTGPVSTCVLTAGNTSGVASSILGGDNAVVVVPSAPLTAGTYGASVTTHNGQTVSWTFNVDPNAVLSPTPPPPPAPLPSTAPLGPELPIQHVTPFRLVDSRIGLGVSRLPAGQQIRVRIAGQRGLPADMSAVSANFTATEAVGGGYLTASNCAEANPSVSTLNFTNGDAVANQAIIPLDRGDVCLFSSVATDVIVDVNGYVSPAANRTFTPVTPKRVLDTRGTGPLVAGAVLRVEVEGGVSPAPHSAVAVAVNLTSTRSNQTGWVRAVPCGVPDTEVSSLNPRVGRDQANSVIVPTAADGTICISGNVTTDLVLDVTGWFGESTAQQFVPVTPLRLLDTRSSHPGLNDGGTPRMLEPGRQLRVQVAGARGIPAAARAATLNLVATNGPGAGWLQVVPCGTGSDVSTLNYPGVQAVANGTNVMLDATGGVCIVTSTPTHVIVDVNGVWT